MYFTINSIVLGIHWEQNSGATLFINGELANVSQKRCSKNDEKYPYEAIERILKDNNIKGADNTSGSCVKQWNQNMMNRHYSAKTVRDLLKSNINIGNRD